MFEGTSDDALLRSIVGPSWADAARGQTLSAVLDLEDAELAELGWPATVRTRLLAVAEVARRCQPRTRMPRPVVEARHALALFRPLRRLRREACMLLLLDARQCAVGIETLAVGGSDIVSIAPRDVFMPAIG